MTICRCSAQSVQNLVPEAVDSIVNGDDHKEYLGVRFAELIPILISGLQEATTNAVVGNMISKYITLDLRDLI